MNKFGPSRPETCVSDLALDLYVTQDPAATDHHEVEDHLRACPACRQRLEAIQVAMQGFPRRAPTWNVLVAKASQQSQSLTMDPKRRPQPRKRMVALRSATWAVAAALLVVALAQTDRHEPESATANVGNTVQGDVASRRKGDVALSFYVLRAGRTFAADPEDPLYPGDRLRFSCSTPQDGYLAIFSRDNTEAITTFFADGLNMAKVTKQQHLLEESVELDTTLGNEEVYGVFCDHLEPISSLRDEIARRPLAPHFAPGCRVLQWTLHKFEVPRAWRE